MSTQYSTGFRGKPKSVTGLMSSVRAGVTKSLSSSYFLPSNFRKRLGRMTISFIVCWNVYACMYAYSSKSADDDSRVHGPIMGFAPKMRGLIS
ncbi:hypothetical protein PoB_003479900 [Plakobranchus ocellatus]|uniref:Uncharacterized protein n=1 Tax=Plakobranchus ocellatus TaxID=259542 RepID=A0AAV4AQ54_9GAST|nr:hypothetical protein PoB_003479900 [Plakobranchus ocellatus]